MYLHETLNGLKFNMWHVPFLSKGGIAALRYEAFSLFLFLYVY